MDRVSHRSAFIVGFVLLSACAGSSAATLDQLQVDAVKVTRVIDGDSLEVVVGGEPDVLRLVGVNAPELDECGGDLAKSALSGLVDGVSLELIVDPENERDRFGRLLGELSASGSPLGARLVELGMAVPLGGSSSVLHPEALQASKLGVGIWGPSWCGGSQNSLAIEAFVPDPAGADDQEGAGEFIELSNTGPETLSLVGWGIRDESTSNRYVFDGGVLEPGQTVRLYSTCGEDSGDTRYWCSTSSVWSNSGDTAFLIDPAGNVASFRFSP